MTTTTDLSILVIDDEAANVGLIVKILRGAGYSRVEATTDPRYALELARRSPPDLVLLDLHMPEMSGVEVMTELLRVDELARPLILILTGDDTREAMALALSSGARDFISKPFDVREVLLRINNLLDLRLLHLKLEDQVLARTAELERARLDLIDRLGMAGEFRDDVTGQHTRRVGIAAGSIAHALGMPDDYLQMITRAAPLHDVGKIAIPDRILLKAGPLTEAEMNVMKTHTTIGARLLSSSKSPLLDMACEIALTHHERWDGQGYPAGLRGSDIPLTGRIVAIADVFDALTQDRPYRVQLKPNVVLNMIREERGRHFDPEVADAFLSLRLGADGAAVAAAGLSGTTMTPRAPL